MLKSRFCVSFSHESSEWLGTSFVSSRASQGQRHGMSVGTGERAIIISDPAFAYQCDTKQNIAQF